MNTKNNKRRRDSKQKIEGIFVELLQSKDLSQIRISDICKLASLNRSTFYANYLDIYDLAEHVKKSLEADVFALYKKENEEHFNSNDFLKLFHHIKENQLFYKTFFKLGYDTTYTIKAYDTNQATTYFNNEHIEYHLEFFKSGFNAVVKRWLANGCKETPEEINYIILSEYTGRAK